MKIFSGTTNPQLAKKIANKLSLNLSPLDIHIFPDGEKRIRVKEKVVDENCIVVQPTAPPVDTSYMELFFIVDALKRSGAEFVTAVIPYLGYQRQDHIFMDGEAVSLEVIARTLQSTGVDHLLCVDLHSIRTPQAFNIPVEHLSAIPLFAQKINVILNEVKNPILISPDMGGIARIKKISTLLDNMNYAAIEKNRDLITGQIEASSFGEGEIKNEKIAFIVDDMVSSGKTIVAASSVLISKGIEEIYVFATHAILSEESGKILQNSPIKKIFVTDSVYISKEKYFPKLEIISITDIIASQFK